jgi:hypothetical protein
MLYKVKYKTDLSKGFPKEAMQWEVNSEDFPTTIDNSFTNKNMDYFVLTGSYGFTVVTPQGKGEALKVRHLPNIWCVSVTKNSFLHTDLQIVYCDE